MSNVGVLVWFSAGVICAFTGLVLARGGGMSSSARFFLVSGLLTLWMACDDLFMVHEFAAWWLDIPELALQAAYVLLVVGWLWSFRTRLLETDLLLLPCRSRGSRSRSCPMCLTSGH